MFAAKNFWGSIYPGPADNTKGRRHQQRNRIRSSPAVNQGWFSLKKTWAWSWQTLGLRFNGPLAC